MSAVFVHDFSFLAYTFWLVEKSYFYWGGTDVLYTKMKKKDSTLLVKDWREAMFSIDTPFVQWLIRNGTHIAGDYGVFQLGKDQICILDPEKKRIALIARGFGPVVAKPPLEEIPKKSPEETNEQTVHEVP